MPDNSHKKTSKSIQWMVRIFILTLLFACSKSARPRLLRPKAAPATAPFDYRFDGPPSLYRAYDDSSRRMFGDLGLDDHPGNRGRIQRFELTLNMVISLQEDHDEIDPDLVHQHVRDHGYNFTIESFIANQPYDVKMTYCDSFRHNYDSFLAAHDQLIEWRLMDIWPDLYDGGEFPLWFDSWVSWFRQLKSWVN